MSTPPKVVISNWDRAYNDGKYDQEAPVPFVADIIKTLRAEHQQAAQGFYPGCGNGRNLVPLLEAGLDIEANDISPVAIEQLKKRYHAAKASVGDFLVDSQKQYDYVLSLQLFQHVDAADVSELFQRVLQLLRPGGLFFLRVNSTHTQIIQKYETVTTVPEGGFTIRYNSGQKTGQRIHFYTAEEIHALTSPSFSVVMPLREEFIPRDDGTYWAQWETILKKR